MPTKAQLTAELETLRGVRNTSLNLMAENRAAVAALQAEKDAHHETRRTRDAYRTEVDEYRDRSRSRGRRSRLDAECLAEADRGKAAAALRIVCKHDRDPTIESMATRIRVLEETTEVQNQEIRSLQRGEGDIAPILLRLLGPNYLPLEAAIHRNWGGGRDEPAASVLDYVNKMVRQLRLMADVACGYAPH
jgi:hypothetical protein